LKAYKNRVSVYVITYVKMASVIFHDIQERVNPSR